MKLYVVEPGSEWLTALVDASQGHEVLVLRITLVEMAAALARRSRLSGAQFDVAEVIDALEHDALDLYGVVEVTPSVCDLALWDARQHALRGYDCVQLAGAMQVNRARLLASLDQLTLVSADRELSNAAAAEGIPVSDPTSFWVGPAPGNSGSPGGRDSPSRAGRVSGPRPSGARLVSAASAT